MKVLKKIYPKYLLFITLAFSIIATACDNPASSGDEEHEEEHHAPQGAVLKMNGGEIARIENGQVTSGSLEVEAGKETSLITIFFIDEDGDEFQPDEPEFSLRWESIDNAIAEIEQHEEDGKWSFHLQGVARGNTSVKFRLWHETEEHADFETPEIPVTVN